MLFHEQLHFSLIHFNSLQANMTKPEMQPTSHPFKEAPAATAQPSKARTQPWRAFCDPFSDQFRDMIAQAPDQKLFNVGDAALTQYAAENR
jgi:hypothetical protein